MIDKRGLLASIFTFCLVLMGTYSASGQTSNEISAASALFDDRDILNSFSCEGRVGTSACESNEFCEVRLGILKSLIRAMDTKIPSLMIGTSRQTTSDYIRSEANASCLDALVGAERSGLLAGARLIGSATEEDVADALGLDDAFTEEAPGCPSKENEAPSIARYGAAELTRQVTYPLEAMGINSLSDCMDATAGFVSQRPQVTFYIAEPDDLGIDFEVIYAQCDTTLLASTADGNWIMSDSYAKQPKLRLNGDQINGKVDIWIGTAEPDTRCNARFKARATAD